ncbi:MAG: phosphodiesterase YaeI [Actinobacteria bacterium ADurb.Bin346]|nr:MAG: phosphodiesterase YaeI [Actinobacteria bacterium ADurb.Bin346]
MDIVFIIIYSCAGATIIASLFYWYAFRYETGNFMLSRVRINLRAQPASDGKGLIKKDAGTESESASGAGSYNSPVSCSYEKKPFFTALHISDLHLRKDRNGTKLSSFIKSLKYLEPDFLFITGDLAEKNEYYSILTDMLSSLKANRAKYAVFGVHDYYNKSAWEFIRNMMKKKKTYKRGNDTEELAEKLSSAGITVLQNEKVSINIPVEGQNRAIRLEIAGIEDPVIEKADINKVFAEESRNQGKSHSAGLPAEKNAGSPDKKSVSAARQAFILSDKDEHVLNSPEKMLICLTHTPDQDLIRDLSANGADLIISGHTHGGQVRLPGIGAIISGCNIKTKYASGLFYFKKFVLFISRGLGTGRYSPFRFYCQPEAVMLEIYLN